MHRKWSVSPPLKTSSTPLFGKCCWCKAPPLMRVCVRERKANLGKLELIPHRDDRQTPLAPSMVCSKTSTSFFWSVSLTPSKSCFQKCACPPHTHIWSWLILYIDVTSSFSLRSSTVPNIHYQSHDRKVKKKESEKKKFSKIHPFSDRKKLRADHSNLAALPQESVSRHLLCHLSPPEGPPPPPKKSLWGKHISLFHLWVNQGCQAHLWTILRVWDALEIQEENGLAPRMLQHFEVEKKLSHIFLYRASGICCFIAWQQYLICAGVFLKKESSSAARWFLLKKRKKGNLL